MATAFRSLGDDHVSPGLRSSHCLGYAASHERDLASCGMGALHIRGHGLLRRRPGEGDHGGPERERRCERIFLDVEQEEVQSKWPIGKLADRRRPGVDLLRRQIMTAHGAQTARTGHGCHEFRSVDRSHAAKRDGMIYL